MQNWSWSDPAAYAYAITTADGADQANGPFRGFMVGVSGDVKVTTYGDTTATFTNVTAGVVHPIRVKRFWATGTTATDIVAVK